jgi:hypothetical protein
MVRQDKTWASEVRHKGEEPFQQPWEVPATIYTSKERGIQKEGLPMQIQCEAPVLRVRHSRDHVLQP